MKYRCVVSRIGFTLTYVTVMACISYFEDTPMVITKEKTNCCFQSRNAGTASTVPKGIVEIPINNTNFTIFNV
jgi:hypothetical protein